jgi:hypothetical protein
MEEFVRDVIYGEIVRSGSVPEAARIGAITGFSADAAAAAMRSLADARIIVLDDSGEAVRFAAPFSTVETEFRVTSGSRSWYAPCAWDAFGIPAALHRDADITTRCAHSRKPIACGVRNGMPYGTGVVHMLVPAARFWDDILYT